MFILNSILLGIGLAMDAFSVSVANSLAESNMSRRRGAMMAAVFAAFQCAMPLIGWALVHTLVELISGLERFVPWIALILLALIGGKMLFEGVRNKGESENNDKNIKITAGTILIQGVATSIDALSVGFTIADYDLVGALICAGIIAIVTFLICITGVTIGRKLRSRFSGVAQSIGGIILIGIGLEIFIKGVFFGA